MLFSRACSALLVSSCLVTGCGDALPEAWKERGVPAAGLVELSPGTTSTGLYATYGDDAHRVLASFEEGLTQKGMETCGTRVHQAETFHRFFVKGAELWALSVTSSDGRSLVSFDEKDMSRGLGNDFIESGCRPASMPPEARKRIEELETWRAGSEERENTAKAMKELDEMRRQGRIP